VDATRRDDDDCGGGGERGRSSLSTPRGNRSSSRKSVSLRHSSSPAMAWPSGSTRGRWGSIHTAALSGTRLDAAWSMQRLRRSLTRSLERDPVLRALDNVLAVSIPFPAERFVGNDGHECGAGRYRWVERREQSFEFHTLCHPSTRPKSEQPHHNPLVVGIPGLFSSRLRIVECQPPSERPVKID
jgi:hypothetical protein